MKSNIVKKIRSKAQIARAIRLMGVDDNSQEPSLMVTVQPKENS